MERLKGGRYGTELAFALIFGLPGKFLVRVDLLPEAARTLAATLMRLAGEVDEEGSTRSGKI